MIFLGGLVIAGVAAFFAATFLISIYFLEKFKINSEI